MANKHFESGKSYTLTDLFSNDIKIFIPDLQRDYCWGTTDFLVRDFMDSLLDLSKSGIKSKLGLIYGYEEPKTHIQLCDGQQRITTLFLLLGLLNRATENNFKDKLLTETNGDVRLQYAIRESTLYFLEDLTKNFFLGNSISSVKEIKNATWYFKDYDLDPSIQSMISALQIIEEKLNEIDDAMQFGNFIVSKLSFLYIDLETRQNGEETFVIINTTGEPLSPTENVKPLLITQQPTARQEECSQKWEEWENFFWQNRGENDTADNGLKEFFRWITLLHLDRKNATDQKEFEYIQEGNSNYDFSTILKISFDDIYTYFEIVKYLFSVEILFKSRIDLLSPSDAGNAQIDWFRLLPTIAYCKKFSDCSERDLLRAKHFFSNIAQIDNVSKAVSDLLPEVLDIIQQLPNEDISSIRNITDISTQILTKEERLKFDLYTNPNYIREEIEERFWKEENHPVWNGEIFPLIQWSMDDGKFNQHLFDAYTKTFNILFHDGKKLDITRRALLTLDLEEYPKIFTGYTNYSFCWEYSDWQTLINENSKEFGKFIKKLTDSNDIYAEQQRMIENSPKKYDYHLDYFVTYPELLEYCHKKNVQWDDELGTWWLIQKSRATRYALLENYILFLDLKKSYPAKGWKICFYEREKTCVVFENSNTNTAIDLFYVGENKYQLQLFNRNDEKTKSAYKPISKTMELSWNGERYESNKLTKQKVVALLKKIIASF